MKVDDIDKTTKSMFKKMKDGVELDENETKLYDAYVDYLKSIKKSNKDVLPKTFEQLNESGDVKIPPSFERFQETKKFKDLISFNTIHEGNNTTNLSIDDSISLANIGGGSSINMMEINGYMSV